MIFLMDYNVCIFKGNTMRSHNRKIDELRPIEFIRNYTKHAEGSVLVKFGDTHVLCNSFEEA